MTISKKALIFFLIVYATVSKLRFKVHSLSEGAVLEETEGKDKNLNEKLGEDNISTTALGLAVSDGVGGCKFSSYYASKVLTTSLAGFFVNEPIPTEGVDIENYHARLVTYLGKSMSDYQWHFNKYMIDYIGLHRITEYQIKNMINQAQVSATVIASQIDNSESENDPNKSPDKAHLLIYSKGDSLMTIFRKTEHPTKAGHFYYRPVVMTADQQYQFNQPFQFTSNVSLENMKDDNVSRVELRKDDIVIQASDGVYDNIHLSMMTFEVNLCFWLAHAGLLSDINGLAEMNPIVKYVTEKYMHLLTSEFPIINEHLTKEKKYKEEPSHIEATKAIRAAYKEAYGVAIKKKSCFENSSGIKASNRFPDLFVKRRQQLELEKASKQQNNPALKNNLLDSSLSASTDSMFSLSDIIDDEETVDLSKTILPMPQDFNRSVLIRSGKKDRESPDGIELEEEKDLNKSIYIPREKNIILNKANYNDRRAGIDLGIEEDISDEESGDEKIKNYNPLGKLSIREEYFEEEKKEDDDYSNLRQTQKKRKGSHLLTSGQFEEDDLTRPPQLPPFGKDGEEEESFIELNDSSDSDSEFEILDVENSESNIHHNGDSFLSGSMNGEEPKVIDNYFKMPGNNPFNNLKQPIEQEFEDLTTINKQETKTKSKDQFNLNERILDKTPNIDAKLKAEISLVNGIPNQPQLDPAAVNNFFSNTGLDMINDFFKYQNLTPHMPEAVIDTIADAFAFNQFHIDSVFQKVSPKAFATQMALSVKFIYKEDAADATYRVLSPFYQRWYLLMPTRFGTELGNILTKKDDISLVAGFVEMENGPNPFDPTSADIQDEFAKIWKKLKVHINQYVKNVTKKPVDLFPFNVFF